LSHNSAFLIELITILFNELNKITGLKENKQHIFLTKFLSIKLLVVEINFSISSIINY